jgi:hypothetical protein
MVARPSSASCKRKCGNDVSGFPNSSFLEGLSLVNPVPGATAGSGSSLRSPVRWSGSRGSFCSTRQRPAWTTQPTPSSARRFERLQANGAPRFSPSPIGSRPRVGQTASSCWSEAELSSKVRHRNWKLLVAISPAMLQVEASVWDWRSAGDDSDVESSKWASAGV